VTYSGIDIGDAVVACARDLRALLERRIGAIDVCDVHVERLQQGRARGASFRIKLHIVAESFDVQFTMTPQADVYMALTKTFDQAQWLLSRLRELSNPTLFRKLRNIAADAWHMDSRRYRVPRRSFSGESIRLG
jgi:hypothetical protein